MQEPLQLNLNQHGYHPSVVIQEMLTRHALLPLAHQVHFANTILKIGIGTGLIVVNVPAI